jgi:GMP synthase (glutamine-hydrolysing)
MRPLLIVQNDPHEGAGHLSHLLAKRNIEQETVLGYSAAYEALAVKTYSGIVVLGGGQAAYETDKYPYVQKEIDLCASFIDAGKPIAGFCLGAQILARALGGDVVANAQKEIGWYDLTLTKAAGEDPLMFDQPQSFPAYHFHGDVIKGVPGAVNLATSAMTEWQLFRHGSNAYGFQYHAEVDQPLIETMCRNNSEYMAANGVDAEAVIVESRGKIGKFESRCAEILRRWLDLCMA